MTETEHCGCGCAVAAWSLGPARSSRRKSVAGVRRRAAGSAALPISIPARSSDADSAGAAGSARRPGAGASRRTGSDAPRPAAEPPRRLAVVRADLPGRQHPSFPHDYGLDPLAFDELDELEDHR
ncbi:MULTISPECIES: hypothetical protein [Actinoalloteichus]|uniref:hypothetical protein n=1 Tax=Actinoalloteichus TaxID=65496 RepID=UPI0012FA17F1|nr:MULTISPECIES: hypothetical protein [Actinoalloteichus]